MGISRAIKYQGFMMERECQEVSSTKKMTSDSSKKTTSVYMGSQFSTVMHIFRVGWEFALVKAVIPASPQHYSNEWE
jgi:hypothetical protein